jgi:hypothetical protein
MRKRMGNVLLRARGYDLCKLIPPCATSRERYSYHSDPCLLADPDGETYRPLLQPDHFF